jgi:DNA repair protein RadC
MLSVLSVEKVHATFLDQRRSYITDEIVADGDGQGIALCCRWLVQRALELGASALILAHNHPSGSAEPSAADIDATHRLEGLLKSVEIELVDHLVIGREAITCMREGGYL